MSKSNETTPNVPTLRFKEFSGEWEKIRLGSIIEEIKNYTSDFNKYPLYSFTIENGVTPKTDRYERNFLVTKDGDTFKIVPPNSFVMNPMNLRFGAINYSKVKIPVSVSGYYNIFEIENGKNNEFWSAYFLTKTAINLYNSVATGSLIEKKRVHFSQFIQLSFFVPSDVEKQKITRFLQLIENRISVQNKIISKYETLIKGIRERVVNGGWQWKRLDELIQEGVVRLNRGNIIPKHQKDNTYKYPVYSSSTQNNGLMGYNDTYMFDKELITWSIDGGGNFFYRKKHKFNVTNVCGIMQVDENVYSYRFIEEMLTYQHSKMKFDYQSKAHPSVISSLYSLPCLPISEQNFYCQLFIALDKKMYIEQCSLNKLKEQKKYLLSKMFI